MTWIVEITEESRTAAILCLESGLGAWTGGEGGWLSRSLQGKTKKQCVLVK